MPKESENSAPVASDPSDAEGTDEVDASKDVDGVDMGMVEEKFQEYNMKYNNIHKATDQHIFMEFRSFKHVIDDIFCFKGIARFDQRIVFHSISRGDEGADWLDFKTFKKAIEKIVDMKNTVRVVKGKTPLTLKEVYGEILILKPGKHVHRFIVFFLKRAAYAEPLLTPLASAGAGTLKQMAKVVIGDLGSAAMGVTWISPVVAILKNIWGHLEAMEKINERLMKFADTLLYLTDTVTYIMKASLYHTDMMMKKLKQLERLLNGADKLLQKFKQENTSSATSFVLSKSHLKEMDDEEHKLESWIIKTLFAQQAESHEMATETNNILKELVEEYKNEKEASKRIEEMLKLIMEKLHISIPFPQTRLETTHGQVAEGGDDNYAIPTEDGAGEIEYVLPPELTKSCSDFLIYHVYEDAEIARELRHQLEREVRKFRLQDGWVKQVIISLLDDFHVDGVRSFALEKALELCTVKLILVTENFVEMKQNVSHALEVFQILERSTTSQVFALRYDGYKGYMENVDFYVQGLLRAAFYEPKHKRFVEKMSELFRCNLHHRLKMEKDLEEKRRLSECLEAQKRQIAERKQELKMNEETREIEAKLENPDLTLSEMEDLEKKLEELKVRGDTYI